MCLTDTTVNNESNNNNSNNYAPVAIFGCSVDYCCYFCAGVSKLVSQKGNVYSQNHRINF